MRVDNKSKYRIRLIYKIQDICDFNSEDCKKIGEGNTVYIEYNPMFKSGIQKINMDHIDKLDNHYKQIRSLRGKFISNQTTYAGHDFIIVEPGKLLEYDFSDCSIQSIIIKDGDDMPSVKLDRLLDTDKHLYKYTAVKGIESNYIADMILNEKASIRATNIFGFADRLEGSLDLNKIGLCHRDIKCNKCTLYKNNRCTRKKICKMCIYKYCCEEVDTGKCSKGYLNNDIKNKCEDDLYIYEILHRYILCLSCNGNSNALIEKFCGRCGFILEYEVIEESKIVHITYNKRPISGIDTQTKIINSISMHGYGNTNTDTYIKELLGYKQSEFAYEDESRIIIYNEDTNSYWCDFTEEELGIKLVRVTFVYDSYMQNLNDDIFNVLDNIGNAILKRGILFEINSSTDFTNGNTINSECANEELYMNDSFRKKFLRELGTSIKNGGLE